MRQPCYFIAHGSPMWLVKPHEPAPVYLKTVLGPQILNSSNKPSTLLIISAHWETESALRVTTAPKHNLLYDYYNFPSNFYDIKYPARGDPKVAQETIQLLKAAGFQVAEEKERGLDHGVFTPLIYMFPNQELPIVQLSLPITNNAADYYRMGEALQPLREKGVMIAGAGFLLHNLRLMMSKMQQTSMGRTVSETKEPWAEEFVTASERAVLEFRGQSRKEEVLKLVKLPSYRTAHPTPEHFAPLIVAAGAAGEDVGHLIHSRWEAGVVSEDTFRFGDLNEEKEL
ncbi:hypothetical protein HDU78_004051 [Chytriomyces hyalinus]|nr:hypothetical protein HDU78_004051 [Chytriomyces hyalinus]